MGYFLGLDASTQSLSAVVINTTSGKVILEKSVNFGDNLPQYDCPNGFIENDDPLLRHSDPMMWLAALDLLLQRCEASGLDWSKIDGVSGSGQQHGSVYLNSTFFDAVKMLDATRPLADQLGPCLSRGTSPIWMDVSTSTECGEIAEAASGKANVCSISGSVPIERFTGPQIRKFCKDSPAAYAATARIHLVSSFMASIIAGGDAGIDTGDGAGMNLMDLATADWSDTLLDATAPGLRDKLPPVIKGGTMVGEVADYFVKKYGFRTKVPIIAWSGDNPCSLIGMGATEPGTAVISLGTSDTFFAAMNHPVTDPNGYGHVFGNPAKGFMCLLCFKNGSLAREKIRNRFAIDWTQFEKAILQDTLAGNNGNILFPYFESEITPLILNPGVRLFGSEDFENWQDAAATVRAIVEAQAMSMKIHSSWISEAPTTIRITGGASCDDGIARVLADVFNVNIQRLLTSNSAGLGAALMAAQGVTKADWNDLHDVFSKANSASIEPNAKNSAVYNQILPEFGRRLQDAFDLD
jgi:xylulokinase